MLVNSPYEPMLWVLMGTSQSSSNLRLHIDKIFMENSQKCHSNFNYLICNCFATLKQETRDTENVYNAVNK